MTEVEEKTEFKFSELSDKAKDAARAAHTGEGYLEYDWWDHTYDDAVLMAAILGITISTTWHKNRHGRDYQTTDIMFTGFCSQGDGASFEGSYKLAPNASKLIREETNDAVLHELADRLSMLQITRKLQGLDSFTSKVTRGYGSGNYSHSGTMIISIEFDPDSELEEEASVIDALDKDITQAMQDFADYIYSCLETEYDWLMSDECVDEYLSDLKFDELGSEL